MLRLILFLFISQTLQAQVTTEISDQYYLVYFRDVFGKIAGNEIPSLSVKSLQRRYQQGITISRNDFAVCPHFITAISQCDVQVLLASRWLNAVVIKTETKRLSAITQLPFVKNIQMLPYHHCKIAQVNNTLDEGIYSSDAQLKMLGLDRLHANGFTGKGKLIAVFDNGFTNVNTLSAYQHIFKEHRMIATKNYVNAGLSVFETGSDGEHGSRVFSLIGAVMPPNFTGAAYDASFLLAVTEDNSKEGLLEEFNWMLAAEWADSIGADIISSSLGYATGFTYGSSHTYDEFDGKTTLITRAANYAASKGILVINAAGNEGAKAWMHVIAPADADSCLAVGAVDVKGMYARFSSTGPTFDGRIKPDVVAMGASTVSLSTYGYLKSGNGTSFACPLIAGFAACLWQAHTTTNNMDLFSIIKASGNFATMPDDLVGWGIPSAAIAFKSLTGRELPEQFSPFENNLVIIPNPVKQNFIIRIYYTGEDAEAQINLYNSLAQQIKQLPVKIHSAYNYFSLSVHDLQLMKGLYVVELMGISQPLSIKNKILVEE